jgi:U3 small nucleolar RNA-associated protein 12
MHCWCQDISLLQAGDASLHREIGSTGNRSDVRALALSDNDQFLVSCGNGGTKLWNPATGACINSVATGYGLAAVFAPGARFAMIGCKDGKIDVVDIGLAAVVDRVDAHTGQVRLEAPAHFTSLLGSADIRCSTVCALCVQCLALLSCVQKRMQPVCLLG